MDFPTNHVLYKYARRTIVCVYLMPTDPTLKSSPKRIKTEISRCRLPGLYRENQLSDINLTDQQGNTRLHIAAGDGRVHDVERLIERGARVAVRNNDGITPYDLADSAGHTVVAAILCYHAEKQVEQKKSVKNG